MAAIFSDDYFLVTTDELLVFDFTAWGWITLIWGIVLVLAAFGLMSGEQWAGWAAIVIVGLNMIAQAAFLAAFPLWGILIMSISVLVLFSLAARWDEAEADMSGPD